MASVNKSLGVSICKSASQLEVVAGRTFEQQRSLLVLLEWLERSKNARRDTEVRCTLPETRELVIRNMERVDHILDKYLHR